MTRDPFSRREALTRFGGGLGGIALASLLGRAGAAGGTPPPYLAGRPQAKRVI